MLDAEETREVGLDPGRNERGLGAETEGEKVVEGVVIVFVEEMGSALVGNDGRGAAEVIAAGDMLVLSWLGWLNES